LTARALPRHLEIIYEITRRFLVRSRIRGYSIDPASARDLWVMPLQGERKNLATEDPAAMPIAIVLNWNPPARQ
jgi:hypothetical protein